MEQKITEEIADFVAKTNYDRLPEEAIRAAKGCILDCLGVALLGSREEASRITIEYGRKSGGSPEATVWTGGIRLPASQAVIINGTMSHVLDYDDYSTSWLAHPTVAIFPAALAMAEKYHHPGRECLLAYVLGVEVGGKLSAAFGNTHYLVGWHNTGTLGSIGATTASAKILNLDVKKIQLALGIGASLANGLRQNFGSMTKSLHAGCANRNGIVAAELAEARFTADENIIEAPLGFSKVLAGGKEQPLEGIPGSLGNPFDIISPGITIKPYPSCGGTHPMIYAMLKMRKEHNLSPSEVAEIECRTNSALPNILIHHRPHQALEGKFSMEFCLAAALADGKVGMEQFTDESINRPEIQDLIPRAKFTHPEDLNKEILSPQEVVVRLKDGREFSQRVPFAEVPGSPQNPITWEEQSNKFRDCTQGIIPAKKIDEIVELVLHFDELRDVNELTELLA